MNLISALIVDDEEHNRNVLNKLIQKYCPQIQILAEATNADDAYTLINNKQPQLVFLDVKMPLKSGFDLLKMFNVINFEVIFVSAFNEFAVTAFEYNALGYILKPIDYNKLIITVNKAILKINLREQSNDVLQFVKTLEPNNDSISKIAVHHKEKVVLLDIKDVLSIEADQGICCIKLVSQQQYHSTKELKLFEGMLKDLGNFIRISKSVILNLHFIASYQKGEFCIIEMKNGEAFEVSRRKKAEVLKKLELI